MRSRRRRRRSCDVLLLLLLVLLKELLLLLSRNESSVRMVVREGELTVLLHRIGHWTRLWLLLLLWLGLRLRGLLGRSKEAWVLGLKEGEELSLLSEGVGISRRWEEVG